MNRRIFLYSYPGSLTRSLIQYLYSITNKELTLSVSVSPIQYKRSGPLSVFTLCSGFRHGGLFTQLAGPLRCIEGWASETIKTISYQIRTKLNGVYYATI